MISLLQQFKNGLSRQEIADFHGVSLRTIYNWEKKVKEYFDETSLIRLICKGCKEGWFQKEEEKKKQEEIHFAFDNILDEWTSRSCEQLPEDEWARGSMVNP